MSGLYYVLADANKLRLDKVSAQLRCSSEAEVTRCTDRGFVWLGDAAELYGPATDEKSGVCVVTSGRLVWPQSVWAQARQLPFSGGVANRPLLARYLDAGPTSVAPYNGAAIII